MKKYITTALLAFSTLGFAGAQQMMPQVTSNMTMAPVGDVEDAQLTCTDLQYTLKLRSKDATTNNEVTALQEFLLDIGLLDSDPTGYFGAATLKAVKTFQRQNGLIASGLVGSFTRKAIKERSCGGSVKPIVETNVPVKQWSDKSTLTVYLNEVALSTASADSKDDAYKKCKEVIAANTSLAMAITEPQVFKCVWNNQIIYSPSAEVLNTKSKANLGTLVIYKNGEVIAKADSMSKEDAYTKCKAYQADYSSFALKCSWNGEVIYSTSAEALPEQYNPTTKAYGPGKNAMNCSSPAWYGLENGKVACYGIWDYGNEFGGDPDMCPQAGYGPDRKTGCIVSTKACASGKAVASKITYPTSMDINSSEIALYAKNLKSTPDAVKQQIPTLWEYTCTDGNTISPVSDTSTLKEEAIGFGVYEGVDASIAYANHSEYRGTGPSETVSGHPERVVYISVPQSAANKVLVLTSYEPANWVLANLSVVRPSKIIIAGYHYQRLTTVDSSPLPAVEINSYEQNKVAKFAYKTSDQYFSELSSWLSLKGVSLKPENFTGTYSAKDNQIFMVPGGASIPSTPSVDSSNSTGAYIVPTNQQVLGASTMCVNLTRNFHRGDESADTRLLQTFLISQEFMDGEVTGYYGDKTVEAVKRYQRNRSLPETGMVFDFTRESITAETCN